MIARTFELVPNSILHFRMTEAATEKLNRATAEAVVAEICKELKQNPLALVTVSRLCSVQEVTALSEGRDLDFDFRRLMHVAEMIDLTKRIEEIYELSLPLESK